MPKITTSAKATIIRENANTLYEDKGASAVYEYANKIGLDYSPCKPCDTSTPNLCTPMLSECLVCGSSK